MFRTIFKWVKKRWDSFNDLIHSLTRQYTKNLLITFILFAGGCAFLSFRGVGVGWKCSLIRDGANCIHSTLLSDQSESEDPGNVEHLEEREAKIITSRYIDRYIESERINQKENLISFVQVVKTDFFQFLKEIRKKRIERTGITDEIDLCNDFMEIVYWVSNLPPSPRYGSWFSLGDKLFFPWEKERFFDMYYPETYRYRIKNYKDRSNLDPRKIWPSKDSFSQGVLSLKAEFQPPIEIRLYPKEWLKIQRGRVESL